MSTHKTKAAGGHLAAFKSAYKVNDNSKLGKNQKKLFPELLPNPDDYYWKHLDRLSSANSNGWAVALCPFHNDHTPSFSVNLIHGGFRCFACGASGGDVLAFHKKFYDIPFVEAAKALGAWKDGA